MRTLSAICLAIALAHMDGTLRIVMREGRLGTFASIEDDFGVIEVQDDLAQAQARVAEVIARAEA